MDFCRSVSSPVVTAFEILTKCLPKSFKNSKISKKSTIFAVSGDLVLRVGRYPIEDACVLMGVHGVLCVPRNGPPKILIIGKVVMSRL